MVAAAAAAAVVVVAALEGADVGATDDVAEVDMAAAEAETAEDEVDDAAGGMDCAMPMLMARMVISYSDGSSLYKFQVSLTSARTHTYCTVDDVPAWTTYAICRGWAKNEIRYAAIR